MQRAVSGIKPTGTPHLGNHLGMIAPAIRLGESYDTSLFIADYHALTTLKDADAMRRHSLGIAAYFLAFGLDPERIALYRQSDVPEVCELAWLLSCVTNMGLLERAHAWKAAKDRGQPGSEVHGLFAYPVLMAADILMSDADVVPVGPDQVQHVEMTRDMAERFNATFGETFRLPRAVLREGTPSIPGLDGRKMSKSYDNTLTLVAAPKALKKQVMQIVTDATPLEDPKDPETCNVFALYRQIATPEEIATMRERYLAGGYGYGHAKLALVEALERMAAGPRDRYAALLADAERLEGILARGAERVRPTARAVVARARAAVGFRA